MKDRRGGVKAGEMVLFTLFALSAPACAQEKKEEEGKPEREKPLPAVLEAGKFSAAEPGAALPEGWRPLTFKAIERHTTYQLVKDEGAVVVKAESKASASGLLREIEVDPRAYPILEWRWKVKDLLPGSDATRKEGDDYPARIYVTFRYDPEKVGFLERLKYRAARTVSGEYPPLAAINYIWGGAERGAAVPSPYTGRARMIVVEAGPEKLGRWVKEERNILEDYRKAFGEEPPPISGVAIMTDTDNTGGSAVAWYGDILFKKKSD